MRRFSCPQKDCNIINEAFLRRHGLDINDVFFTEQGMTAAALAMQQDSGGEFCALPFCHTTEAEGFGANIVFTAAVGAKAGEYIAEDLEELSELPDWDMSSDRFAAALGACRRLKEMGKKVIFNITGPCGIMNCLMPSSAVFIALRDDSEELHAFYEACRRNLLRFAAAAADAGADCISYGDPIAAGDMLGPVYSQKLAEDFILAFLDELRHTLGERASLTVCPKTGLLLKDVLSEEEMPEFVWRTDRELSVKAAAGAYCCCSKMLLRPISAK